jgi:hypothetical protein
VADRQAAFAGEAQILALYRTFEASNVGPQDFPQGGWTETWREDGAPPLDLATVCASAGRATS